MTTNSSATINIALRPLESSGGALVRSPTVIATAPYALAMKASTRLR